MFLGLLLFPPYPKIKKEYQVIPAFSRFCKDQLFFLNNNNALKFFNLFYFNATNDYGCNFLVIQELLMDHHKDAAHTNFSIF